MRDFGGRIVRFCPHFRVDERVACLASEDRTYWPSEFQQKEFCTADSHTLCAIYLMRAPDSESVGVPFSSRDS